MSLIETHCPVCRSAVPPDALEKLGGLCLACLSSFALEDEPTEASSGAMPRDLPLQVGTTFRNLKVMDVIGWGGMGVVYKARQEDLDRFVALKVIGSSLAWDDEFARRFNGEAKALATLNHSNIVQVFDFGREGSLYFLVMEFVEGSSLRHVISGGPVNPAEALKIVTQICTALEYAHSKGVIHRDIKPENILIDRAGAVKIADFGLAKIVDGKEPTKITQTGQVLGTAHYIAPELLAKEPADHRADIYSLGVVFYEMLTGEVPLGRFAPPSKRVRVDVRLDEVVLKALEREPGRRYARASDLKTRVEILRSGKFRPRWPRPLVLAMTALLAAGVAGGVFMMTRPASTGTGAPPAPPPPPSGIDHWLWGNRGEIKESRGDEISVPQYRDVPLMTARPDGHALGDRFTLRFKLKYEIDPKNEPWILLMFDGPESRPSETKVLILFPEGDHKAAWADLQASGGMALRDLQPMPQEGPKPGQWHQIEVTWDGSRRHLRMTVDGKPGYEADIDEEVDLSGSWRFGFGGAAKEIRIKEASVLNAR